MCGDAVEHDHTVSRRTFLRTSAALTALSIAGVGWQLPRRTAMASADDLLASSMAMHIHSSFSEQSGSMASQLFQAQTNSVDVLWWTDHDHRMSRFDFRKTLHFTSLTAEQGAPGEGKAWHWLQTSGGSHSADSVATIVDSPASPLDPVAAGSLQLLCRADGYRAATSGVTANSKPAGWNYEGSLVGQSLALELLPAQVGPQAYVEVRIATSHHRDPSGGPTGVRTLSYRIGGADAPGTRRLAGLTGVVTLAAQPGVWNSLVLRPTEDLAALWPELDSRDFALSALSLHAVAARKATALGYVDYLRFVRSSGEVLLQAQQDMMADLAPAYPGVTQYQGVEVSPFEPHLNWFGGSVVLQDWDQVPYARYRSHLADTIVPQIHSSGGLVSFNHPYGANAGPLLSAAAMDQKLSAVATKLLGDDVLGCDIMEVGYKVRGSVDLAHHTGLWDVLSRNARFITGNGASDDHFGVNWAGLGNGWTTSTWSADRSEAGLLGALAAGRTWTGLLMSYRGSLDLLMDGSCPMGSASVSALPSRELTLTATDLPPGGTVRVLQGAVDYAGTAQPVPTSRVVAGFRATDLAGGTVSLPIDTSAESFVRTEVVNSAGAVVGLSNPVWLLQQPPPDGIPLARAC